MDILKINGRGSAFEIPKAENLDIIEQKYSKYMVAKHTVNKI